MAEINNSLALGIKNDPIDIAKTLQQAAAINSLRANTAKTQQDIEYNQFLQDQGGGYRPDAQNTLQEVYQKKSELRGRAANEIVNDPSDEGVKAAFKHFEQAGTPLPDEVKKSMLAMSPEQRRQRALQIQQGAQPSSTAIEQSPGYKATSQAATIHGTRAGEMGVQPPPLIPTAPVQPTNRVWGDKEGQNAGIYPKPGEKPPAGPDYSQPGAMSSAASDLAARNKTAADRLAKTDQDYAAAQDVKARVAAIDHDIETLGPAWMGAGAETKAQFAKTWNGIVETAGGIFGAKPNASIMFDPSKVATTEDFYKEQIRAGMGLINSSFGDGREAQSVVQMGKAAVAGLGNTYLGAKTVLNMIDSIAERQARLQEFKTNYKGPLYEAEIAFNKTFPPKMFTFDAITKSVPDSLIQRLRANPSEAKMFDDAVHTPGLADYILTGKL